MRNVTMMTILRRRSVFALLFALTLAPLRLAAADELFPCELTHFEPASDKPIFTAAGEGHWENRIRERGWILREDDGWHLWYTGYDGTREGQKKLGYATSADGITWTRYPGNPIYDETWVEDMMVARDGDTYFMFAEGEGDRAFLLSSTDKIRWTRQGTIDIRHADGTPIEAGAYGTPFAFKQDGAWYLFYERGDKAVWLAKSGDMKVWTNIQDEPVLVPGPAKYDSIMIAINQVIRRDGRYYAYYHGTGSETKPALWTSNIATSTDLIHWTKYDGNPLLPLEDNRSSNFVVFDGTQYRLYTTHDRVDVYLPNCK